MIRTLSIAMSVTILAASPAMARDHGDSHGKVVSQETHGAVSNGVIAEQRKSLADNTYEKGFGPQSPRDIDSIVGINMRAFSEAPAYSKMNLCNIHFHKNAEHKSREFSTYAGNGDGHGYLSGYKYDTAKLSKSELKPSLNKICDGAHGDLRSGDTIEVHYVYSTAQVSPGATLSSCLSETVGNPQLRVEAQVFVLVNDKKALDFRTIAAHGYIKGLHQASGIPSNTGTAVQYEGSTTGPSYNEKGSPFHVSWSVRPKVAKVNIATVGKWCKGNTFKEDHAHGVRNLVKNPALLSEIN